MVISGNPLITVWPDEDTSFIRKTTKKQKIDNELLELFDKLSRSGRVLTLQPSYLLMRTSLEKMRAGSAIMQLTTHMVTMITRFTTLPGFGESGYTIT